MRLQVKDQQGNVVRGLYRSPNGVLIVDDSAEFNKYNREKQSAAEINQLRSEVDQLKQLVATLLRDHNG